MSRLHQENSGLIGKGAPRGFAGANLNLGTLCFYLSGESFKDTAPSGAGLLPSFTGSGLSISGDSSYVGGRSIYFPGDLGTQYLIYPHNSSIDLGGTDWTVACRVKWTGDTSHYNAIFAKRQGSTEYEGYLNITDGTVDYYNGANYRSSTVLAVGQWYHLAYQFKNGIGLRIYVNGSQVASFNVTSTASSTNHLVIGGVSGLFEPFGGFIQDLAIWRSLPWNFDSFTPPTAPILPISRSTGSPSGGIIQLGSRPLAGSELVVTDTGQGRGFTIAQGADGTNVTGFTNTGMTAYKLNTDNQGVNGTSPLAYTCSANSFNFHTGHQPSWWPAYYAINVTTSQYGKVLNQLQWLMHNNMAGNCDIFGSNREITSSNFSDESLWSHLGRVNAGGRDSGFADCTVRTLNFNYSNYGFRWYMIKIVDSQKVYLPYPESGSKDGWAAMGLRLNKV